MTDKEFRTFCDTMAIGTPLSFDTGEEQVQGTFAGCTAEGVVLKVHDKLFIWQPELIERAKPGHPTPSYS